MPPYSPGFSIGTTSKPQGSTRPRFLPTGTSGLWRAVGRAGVPQLSRTVEVKGHPDPLQPSPLILTAAVIIVTALLLFSSFTGIRSWGCCRAGLGWSLLLGLLLLLLLPFLCCFVWE